MSHQFIKDAAATFTKLIYENNRKVVPMSATLTVYKPGGSEKLIDAQAMTVGADGLLSYNLTALHNAVLGEGYKAVISYVYGGTTTSDTELYDVVNSRLAVVITDDDIVSELPQLKDNGWRVHTTASSGSATTIVSNELKRYDDYYFTGGLAYSPSKNETREVTDFVSSTGTVTTSSFSSAVSAAEKIILTRAFTREIRRAFEKIEEMLRARGKRSQLILDSSALRGVHIYLSVAEACKGFTKDGEGSYWWEMWKYYEKKGEDAFGRITFSYDASGDGYISGAEARRKMGPIKVRF